MKKNGIHSNTRRLTLVSSTDPERSHGSEMEDAAVDAFSATRREEADSTSELPVRTSRQALMLVVVSVACASAAIAAGTYALWLTRRQAAQSALTDVRDLLRTCQDRMEQMEDDLHRLPHPIKSSPA